MRLTEQDDERKAGEVDASLIQREVFQLALSHEQEGRLTLREALELLDEWPDEG